MQFRDTLSNYPEMLLPPVVSLDVDGHLLRCGGQLRWSVVSATGTQPTTKLNFLCATTSTQSGHTRTRRMSNCQLLHKMIDFYTIKKSQNK